MLGTAAPPSDGPRCLTARAILYSMEGAGQVWWWWCRVEACADLKSRGPRREPCGTPEKPLNLSVMKVTLMNPFGATIALI